jgi:hypothetical protein
MGTSRTIPVILEAQSGRLFPASSRVEIAQTLHAYRDDETFLCAYAQTFRGCAILKSGTFAKLPIEEVRMLLPKLPPCPVCEGRRCSVCNFSGICRPSQVKGYQKWQIDMIRDEVFNQHSAVQIRWTEENGSRVRCSCGWQFRTPGRVSVDFLRERHEIHRQKKLGRYKETGA